MKAKLQYIIHIYANIFNLDNLLENDGMSNDIS